MFIVFVNKMLSLQRYKLLMACLEGGRGGWVGGVLYKLLTNSRAGSVSLMSCGRQGGLGRYFCKGPFGRIVYPSVNTMTRQMS